MYERNDRTKLADSVARFETDMQRLAWKIVGIVVVEELARRAVRPRKKSRAAAGSQPRRQANASETSSVRSANSARVDDAKNVAPPPTSAAERSWTRERVLDELATWLLSGTTFDAAFVNRHGPRGLVSAARRIFGRFDAALNHANLHLARRYPDGPPTRG